MSDLAGLSSIDWKILQNRDFKRDPENDPGKVERYEAEALVYKKLPISALLGIVCYSDSGIEELQSEVASRGMNLKVIAKRGWYF
jgi:hypothetical protein